MVAKTKDPMISCLTLQKRCLNYNVFTKDGIAMKGLCENCKWTQTKLAILRKIIECWCN